MRRHRNCIIKSLLFLLFAMHLIFIIVLLIVVVVSPILPSILLACVSAQAFRKNRRFLYYNASFAAIYNAVLLILYLLFLLFTLRQPETEAIWVLLAMPVVGLTASVSAFSLGFIAYNSNGSFENQKQLPLYPFRISVAAIVGFALSWVALILILIFQPIQRFR